jgi:dihydroneopterin aldolase
MPRALPIFDEQEKSAPLKGRVEIVPHETLSARTVEGIARNLAGCYTISIRDFVAPFSIGVYEHEKRQRQRVRVNIDLVIEHPEARFADDIGTVMSYEDIIGHLRHLAEGGHTQIIERLCDRIGDLCLSDPRVTEARVRVEKLEVFPEATSVGVTVTYSRGAAGKPVAGKS